MMNHTVAPIPYLQGSARFQGLSACLCRPPGSSAPAGAPAVAGYCVGAAGGGRARCTQHAGQPGRLRGTDAAQASAGTLFCSGSRFGRPACARSAGPCGPAVLASWPGKGPAQAWPLGSTRGQGARDCQRLVELLHGRVAHGGLDLRGDHRRDCNPVHSPSGQSSGGGSGGGGSGSSSGSSSSRRPPADPSVSPHVQAGVCLPTPAAGLDSARRLTHAGQGAQAKAMVARAPSASKVLVGLDSSSMTL